MISRRATIIAATAAIAIVTPAVIAAALFSGRAPPAEDSPTWVVTRFTAHLEAGRHADAFALFDFEDKAQFLLPDLWPAGDAEDRAAMVSLLKDLLFTAFATARDAGFYADGTTLAETRVAADHAMVEETPNPTEGRADESIRYWLKRDRGQWRIYDRTYRIGRQSYDARGTMDQVRGKIAAQLGHPPTLREVAKNAPTWVGKLRRRRVEIDQ